MVVVQDAQAGELGQGGEQQVWDRGGAVLAALAEPCLHLDGTVLGAWGEVLDRHHVEQCTV